MGARGKPLRRGCQRDRATRRPAGWCERAVLWRKRHKRTALSVLAVVCFVSFFAGGYVAAVDANRALIYLT